MRPGTFTYVSGHRDAPLSPRGRLIFWGVVAVVVVGSIVGIILTRSSS